MTFITQKLMRGLGLLSTGFLLSSSFFYFSHNTKVFANQPHEKLVYCSEGSPEGFDPGQYTTGTTFDVTDSIYGRLMDFKIGESTIVPGLAESYEVSKDYLTYTFHLRKGVQWQKTPWFTPTREFNADDVIFTFNRAIHPDDPYNKAYPAIFPYYSDMGLTSNIDHIEKVDDYTVKIVLKNVQAPFLQNLAMPFSAILSKEYADQLLKKGKLNELNVKPVGTGPFILKSYQKDTIIRFEANPTYWNKKNIFIKDLLYSITTDASVRLQKMKRNECQVSINPKPADVAEVKNDPHINVLTKPAFNIGFLAFNTSKPPFDNIKVRKALTMAIDKNAILHSVYQGTGIEADGLMPSTQWGWDPTAKVVGYDLDAAKKMLQESGVKNLTITLYTMPVQRAYNPNARLMAEMIQSDRSKIGVKTNVVSYEWGEYIRRLKAGNHDAALIGWTGDNGDPDNWLGTTLSCDSVGGNNFSHWCYKPFNDLIVQARSISDQKKRIELYKKAQQIGVDNVPFAPIASSLTIMLANKSVKNFVVTPLGRTQFVGVRNEP